LERLKVVEALEGVRASSIPKGSVVYIRYKDHVLFKNTSQPVKDIAERETVGWLTQETGDLDASNMTEQPKAITFQAARPPDCFFLKYA
jgi:hypothetical protein